MHDGHEQPGYNINYTHLYQKHPVANELNLYMHYMRGCVFSCYFVSGEGSRGWNGVGVAGEGGVGGGRELEGWEGVTGGAVGGFKDRYVMNIKRVIPVCIGKKAGFFPMFHNVSCCPPVVAHCVL